MMRWLLAFGTLALGALATLLRRRAGGDAAPELDARAHAVELARAEIGKGDPTPYWRDTLSNPTPPFPHDWCGAFALWALHQAGIAVGVHWVIGKGFAGNLPQVKVPEPADIAYFDHFQHHALVDHVDDAGQVHLINGNGLGGKVTTSVDDPHKVTAFFSVAPLLPTSPGTPTANV